MDRDKLEKLRWRAKSETTLQKHIKWISSMDEIFRRCEASCRSNLPKKLCSGGCFKNYHFFAMTESFCHKFINNIKPLIRLRLAFSILAKFFLIARSVSCNDAAKSSIVIPEFCRIRTRIFSELFCTTI